MCGSAQSIRALSVVAVLTLAACGAADAKVAIVFPDANARDATSALAVTVFEPLLFVPERDKPDLVKCGSISVFPPVSVVDPEQFASTPNLGAVLKGPREQRAYPLDGTWSLDVAKADGDSDNNPWGAVAVFVEARGEATAPLSEGGGTVSATLLQGCYCMRTREGSHPDRALDQAVKTSCPLLGTGDMAEQEIELEPVTPAAFSLVPRGPAALTSPSGQPISPGPAVEVTTRRCDDVTSPGGTTECFRCPQPCEALNDRGRVPVQFVTMGGAQPERQTVLTDAAGVATANLTVGACTSAVTVRAEVVGRAGNAVEYQVSCVEPISEFRCDPEVPLLPSREAVAIATVPGSSGRSDVLAVLSDSGARATLEVLNPETRLRVPIDFPEGERARALHAFFYDLDNETLPLIAVATSGNPDAEGGLVSLFVFEWTGSELRPRDRGAAGSVGTPLTECGSCACDCECKLRVALQTDVTLTAADVDGDRRSDLLIGTSTDKTVTRFFSTLSSTAAPYRQDNCRCAQYGQPPGTFQALDIGGPYQSEDQPLPDLIIGSSGGSFVRYGEEDQAGLPDLTCGQPQRFGLLAPMRDLARGRFACDRRTSSDCRFDDLVLVSAKTISGSTFEDAGNIGVVFGSTTDISDPKLRLFSTPELAIDLPPRTFAGSEGPKIRGPRRSATSTETDTTMSRSSTVRAARSTPGSGAAPEASARSRTVFASPSAAACAAIARRSSNLRWRISTLMARTRSTWSVGRRRRSRNFGATSPFCRVDEVSRDLEGEMSRFRNAPRTWGALAGALLALSCGSGEKSVALVFPNESARLATVRVVVEVFSPGSGADERDCASFIGRSEMEEETFTPIARGDYAYPFTADQQLTEVPKGRQIIFVRTFADRLESSLPILEGCTAEFDSGGGSDEHVEVPIRLEVVIPKLARLIKVEGDRQVGRPGEPLPVKLKVRLVSGEGAAPHRIPGVAVRFESKDGDFTLVGGSSPKVFDSVTDAEGEASVEVEVPDRLGTGTVDAAATELEASDATGTKFRQSFALSVTQAVTLPTATRIAGNGQRVISVALGRVTGGAGLDAVVLSCEGSEGACDPAPTTPSNERPGPTWLAVYADVTSSGALVPIGDAALLGIGPSALAVTDLRPDRGVDDIAVLNRRRVECQDRVCTDPNTCSCYGVPAGGACPCESSEVLILSDHAGTVRLDQRATTTASNAVTMVAYTTDNGPYRNLAVAASGRSKNERPCGRTGAICLPSDLSFCASPEECGCPPLESCECPECVAQSQPGVCTAQDRFVDLLINRWNVTAGAGACAPATPGGACADPDRVCQRGVCVPRLHNAFGCQTPEIDCGRSTCGCEDGSLNDCSGSDTCGCKVPSRVFVGGFQNPRRPFSLAAGAATDPFQWDLVATTDSGLELIRARAAPQSFEWDGTPKVNAPIHGALIASFDSEVDSAGDVAWFSKRACLDGFEDTCPFFKKPGEGDMPKGCLGLYYTDGEPSIFQLRTPARGGCRRYSLDFSPTAMCVGRFNRDAFIDVVLASDSASSVYVFTGDGRGGLHSAPDVIPLPSGGTGGPLACGDVDGDGIDDAVVASRANGDVFVLRSGP